MAETKKTDRIAALRLEVGKNIAAAWAFNGSTIQTLGADHLIPYEELSVKGATETVDDGTIDGAAFMDLPVQVQKTAALDGFGSILKYDGLTRLFYWMFGFEDGLTSPREWRKFTVSGVTTPPAVGDKYTHPSDNDRDYFVREVSLTAGAGTLWLEVFNGTTAPSASGTLTRETGSGDATISFSAVTVAFFLHIWEVDKHERNFLPYRTGENTAGDADADDRKNRFATIGVKEGPSDKRYVHTICKSFSITSKAGDLARWSASGIGAKEERGSFSSATWTAPAGTLGSALDVRHSDFTVKIGPSGSLVAVGVSEFSIEVEIPIQVLQDTESGLFIAEPVLEGKYNVRGSITLSRHTVDTYLANRDAFDALALSLEAENNDFKFGLYLPDIRLVDTPVAEADVPTNPLTFVTGKEPAGGNPFTTEIGGVVLFQKGPLFLLNRNKSAANEMRRE